jgi:hypothetical protein
MLMSNIRVLLLLLVGRRYEVKGCVYSVLVA